MATEKEIAVGALIFMLVSSLRFIFEDTSFYASFIVCVFNYGIYCTCSITLSSVTALRRLFPLLQIIFVIAVTIYIPIAGNLREISLDEFLSSNLVNATLFMGLYSLMAAVSALIFVMMINKFVGSIGRT